MLKHSTLLFTFITLMNYYTFSQTIAYADKKHAKADFDNRKQQLQSLNSVHYYQHMENSDDSIVGKSSPPLKHMHNQHHKLGKNNTNSNLIYDLPQMAARPRETTKSSHDHLHSEHIAAYITPSPSNLEMHLNFQHHLPLIVYKKSTFMSHATNSKPLSAITTESIKSLASITAASEERQLKSDFKDDSNPNEPVGKAGSKQFIYAPLRSSLDKALPYSSNVLPYPPSFITITTTEKPLFNSKAVHSRVPDFFSQRQYRSLWDSYIPSWQIMNMLQQFKNKSNAFSKINLRTLAFIRQNKKEIEK